MASICRGWRGAQFQRVDLTPRECKHAWIYKRLDHAARNHLCWRIIAVQVSLIVVGVRRFYLWLRGTVTHGLILRNNGQLNFRAHANWPKITPYRRILSTTAALVGQVAFRTGGTLALGQLRSGPTQRISPNRRQRHLQKQNSSTCSMASDSVRGSAITLVHFGEADLIRG